MRYVALGDSYSSGEGNPPFYSLACHRSVQAWPQRLATQVSSIALVKNLACSGADTGAYWSSFHGQKPQRSELLTLKPNLVTVTLGGNDVGFSSVLTQCFVSDCVLDGGIDRAAQRAVNLSPRLVSLYRAVKADAKGARVLVVGYPSIFPASQSAVTNCRWLQTRERAGLVNLASRLDRVERLAARKAGVTYASTLTVLAGHELCTRDSWVFPIEVECAVPGYTNCGHPLPPGQAAVARAVKRRLAH